MFDRLGPKPTEPDGDIRERDIDVNYPHQEHYPPGDQQFGEHHGNLNNFNIHNNDIHNPGNRDENYLPIDMNHGNPPPTLDVVLETLCHQKTPYELALHLNIMSVEHMCVVLDEVFNSDVTYLHKFLEALAKCCKTKNSHTKSELLGKVSACNFFVHPKVHHVMLQVIAGNEDDGQIHNVVRILEIVNQIMIHRPSDLEHIQALLVLLDGIMVRIAGHNTQRMKELHRLHLTLSKGENAYKEHMENLAQREQHKELSERLGEHQPILQVSDVLDPSERYIPNNDVKVPHKSVHDYLQVHFKLMHEDFLQPLRKGVQHFREHVSDKEQQSRFRDYDIKVYEGVKVVTKKYNPSEGILFTVKVQDKSLDRNSQRMIFGSLMCLLNADLTTVLFTTLAGKDNSKAGLLDLRLETEDDSYSQELFESEFIMIESTAFYRASKFVLEGLRKLHSSHPEHLSRLLMYFACPFEEVERPVFLNDKPDLEYDFSCLLQSQDQELCSLTLSSTWPAHSAVGLNESQYTAFKTALQMRFQSYKGHPGQERAILEQNCKITAA